MAISYYLTFKRPIRVVEYLQGLRFPPWEQRAVESRGWAQSRLLPAVRTLSTTSRPQLAHPWGAGSTRARRTPPAPSSAWTNVWRANAGAEKRILCFPSNLVSWFPTDWLIGKYQRWKCEKIGFYSSKVNSNRHVLKWVWQSLLQMALHSSFLPREWLLQQTCKHN